MQRYGFWLIATDLIAALMIDQLMIRRLNQSTAGPKFKKFIYRTRGRILLKETYRDSFPDSSLPNIDRFISMALAAGLLMIVIGRFLKH